MRGVIAKVLLGLALVAGFSGLSEASVSTGSSSNTGSHFTGFVKVAEGRELYVDFHKPVPGKPTILLLNGLTYRVGSWDAFVHFLEGHGYGILRYDPMGMGQTLLRYAPATGPFMLKDQISDLNALLTQLKVREPVHVVGLSYGGALGMQFSIDHPERVATLTLMAPFVAALDSQDMWIRLQIQQTRLLFPYNKATFDELYDYFLRQIVYASYPVAEPIVLENPYKLEATFRLVQGIRKFLAKDIAEKLPKDKVHLVIARRDQYVSNETHDAFWNQLPKHTRASRLFLEGTEHKIPEAVPAFAASWVRRIVDGDPLLAGGKTFIGNPWRGTTSADKGSIEVVKE